MRTTAFSTQRKLECQSMKVGCVPKAPIAGADINDCYLEAAIKISTTNAYFVPFATVNAALCSEFDAKRKFILQ
jgi:hypothetical protein